ncbi:MAG: hypothetical protein NW201_10340 [Gemmatimonadales bacterium]|nr:hypothetical protein [Gemmatimonadales bacterium]
MFIELTDHLRCPADHDEAFLVLIAGPVERRDVRAGTLGCPVCQAEFPIVDGVADLRLAERQGTPPQGDAVVPDPLSADAISAFLGLSGPGGYAVLCGSSARHGAEVVAANPGVAFTALNAPAALAAAPPALSLVLADRIPFKARSMRGVVLGAEQGAPVWTEEALRVTLPGLRVVGPGVPPTGAGVELLGEAGGWWVVTTR